MKNLLKSICLMCFVTTFLCCSEDDFKEETYIFLQRDTIFMKINGLSFVDFSISTTNFIFNYDVGSSNCDVFLCKNGDGVINDYGLEKIEPIEFDFDGKPKKYRAYIRDYGTHNYYKDTIAIQFKLYPDSNAGGAFFLIMQ